MCYIEPLSVLSVCLSVYDVNVAYCHNRGQSVGWINVPLDMKVDLGPGNIVLDGDPAPHQKGGTAAPPHFSAHVYCGQTAGWIKMLLGMEVRLGPGDIV